MKSIFLKVLFVFLIFESTCYAEIFDAEFKSKNIDAVAAKLTDDTSLSFLALGTISVLQTQNSNVELRNKWKDNQQMSYPISSAGNFIGIGVGSGLSLAAQYYFDDNSNHWQNHARTIVWTTVTVTGMKYAFGEQRPGNKNYEAFPSGHTAISFATATSLTYAYGYKAALIAYPIAALVGLSRMADDMHWASDVVGGAFWGVLMARACEQDDTPSKVSWLPLYSRDFFSVSMTKNF